MAEFQVALPVLVVAAGLIIWGIRLEGRVNTHEAVCAERYKRLDEKATETTDKLHAIDEKLDRLISAP